MLLRSSAPSHAPVYSSLSTSNNIVPTASYLIPCVQVEKEQAHDRKKDLLQKKGYKYEDVRSASKAGGGFFKFILSVVSFYDVAKEIRPKRERVKMLEKELMKAKRELQRLNDEVAYLEEMLLNLRRQYAEAQNEMERLRNDMNIMLRQLLAAEKLTSGLASEKVRSVLLCLLTFKNRVNLVGHCLLASAFLNYEGPFTQEFRTRIYKRWLDNLIVDEIPLQEGFKLNELLTSEVEISLWNSQGLPPDELSIQNAILTTKGPKTPICIDPQGQATKWIRMMELNPKDETRSIKITTLNDPNFLRTLENCVKFGVAIMFTSVEENIDPVLDNILSRNIKKEKGREVIMLGDREVEYDWGFRLYLTSKLPNPNENKRILKELEDRLLLELATQTGNILDNWELINTLEDTKAKAVEVAKALELAAVVSVDIDPLFEDHKLLLSFQLAIRMEQEEKKLRPKELNYFVRGNLALTDEHFTPPYSWIPEPTWRDILYLAAFLPNKFGKLPYDVVKHPDAWKEWYDSETPEVNDIPGRFNKLASFSRLCLVRVWRTDRVPAGITRFIFDAMGKSFVSPPMTALGDVLASTSPVIPIVLIVQPGSDPPAALTGLAQSVAEALFASCMARGHWLVLQNCHLLLSYTSRLEKMLEDAVKPHPDFRLWATTELISNFPNIQASLNKLDDAQFVASAHPKYRPIMFVLIFLHAILQERRRYGKLGWNVSYDFADSDLLVMYGGRTIDNYDRRVLTTYMEEYFGDFLFDEFQTFHFYHDDTIDYMIPLEPEGCEDFREMYLGKTADMLLIERLNCEAIENWPLQQRPNVFGLHENTAIGYSARFARQLWVCLQRLLPETELVTGIPDAQQMSTCSKDVIEFAEKLKAKPSEEPPPDANAPAPEEPAEPEEDSLATPRDDPDDDVSRMCQCFKTFFLCTQYI
ncbi:unnamed protein product [Dibothriocephalus latus]|uniref:Dynein heavy chain ATP-binding dynein motor region domain-containing protein n=1 Tax=Dibothriocephalus latus TaxID=60516 RepID=A0A3P6V597_DIBLA|nr:unnamed protein product [Dibothriocephalus latus]